MLVLKKCQNHWTRYSYREFLPSHDASPAIHVENLANFHILTSSRSQPPVDAKSLEVQTTCVYRI